LNFHKHPDNQSRLQILSACRALEHNASFSALGEEEQIRNHSKQLKIKGTDQLKPRLEGETQI